MKKPSRAKLPKPDAADQALLNVAETLLDSFFLDGDNEATYEDLFTPGGPRLTRTQQLGEKELSDDGVAVVFAEPRREHFLVVITHPKFSATLHLRYDVAEAAGSNGKVTSFTGDRRTARKMADTWFEELNTLDLNEIFGADSFGEDDGEEAPALGEDPGEPPPPTRQDAERVAAIARVVGEGMGDEDAGPPMSPFDRGWLEATPQALWPMLEQMTGACTADPRDEDLIQAYQFLIGVQLEFIRYRIDVGWEWAKQMAIQYQQRLIEIGREKKIEQDDWFGLVSALSEAKIPVESEMREAMAEAGLEGAPAQSQDEMIGLMRELLDQMAAAVETPFDVISGFSDATKVMPEAMRSFMVHEFALSGHAKLRDAVPLMLLDGEREVRQAAAMALEQTAAPDTLSPVSLRRMIAMRNWLPEAERAGLDQAIRKARGQGVECAQWPKPTDITVTATIIDGSGAQNLFVTSKGGRRGMLTGVLLKMGFGIRDCWGNNDVPRNEITALVRELRDQAPCSEVERHHLDTAVQHAIGTGVAQGNVPPATFLEFAEQVGGADWRDRRLGIPDEAKRLFEAIAPALTTDEAIETSLKRSGRWMRDDPNMTDSWFEDGAEIRAVVARAPRRDKQAAVQMVLEDALPNRRMAWAERFVLMALWARAAKDRTYHARWQDFAVLAHELCGDRTLADIPLMAAVAENTLVAARAERW